ncbi:MAG: M23 family metallopeptidase [Treponema sp.]|nr:M23 family metallopeptidase [Treponema sp.]
MGLRFKRKRNLWPRLFLPYMLAPLLSFSALAGISPLGASPLPLIPRLDSRDQVFRQFIADVEAGRRQLFSSPRGYPGLRALGSQLTIYSYIPAEHEDLLSIAARTNIPYSTLVSLNRLSNRDDIIAGRPLLLPSIPGLFIPEAPETDLERLLLSSRTDQNLSEGVRVSIPRGGGTEGYIFIPGDDFSATERIFYFNREFRFPLRNYRVSSMYGPRVNPVTGTPTIHRGLDLAAPEGTEVYATRRGTVIDIGNDPILGRYIILAHDNNWVSLYGHLSAVETSLQREVLSGSLIGRVGSTGQSTGPHLHFELRQDGQSRDPARLLGIFQGDN